MFYSCILIGERVREKERGGERERERGERERFEFGI